MPGKKVEPLTHAGRHGIACIPAPNLALGHGQAFGQVPVGPADGVKGGAVFDGGHMTDRTLDIGFAWQRVFEPFVLRSVQYHVPNVLTSQHVKPEGNVVTRAELIDKPTDACDFLSLLMFMTRHNVDCVAIR